MVKTNRPQREALGRVYRRIANTPLPIPVPGKASIMRIPTYREFRAKVVPGPGCIMAPYAGMWLGIEPDGYTHS